VSFLGDAKSSLGDAKRVEEVQQATSSVGVEETVGVHPPGRLASSGRH
jgi:hypothetical protein